MLLPVLAFAQITKTGEQFTNVHLVKDKVVFIKEIALKEKDYKKNYSTLKDWTKRNYAKDPFVSGISLEDKSMVATAKSRIELVLPENTRGTRERMTMRYRLDAFFVDEFCVVEITNMVYHNNPKANGNTLPKTIKAEDLITDNAINIDDADSETRLNTKKSTLYFVNQLINSLQEEFNR